MCDVFPLIPGLIQSPVRLGVFLCPREDRSNEPEVSAGQGSLLNIILRSAKDLWEGAERNSAKMFMRTGAKKTSSGIHLDGSGLRLCTAPVA